MGKSVCISKDRPGQRKGTRVSTSGWLVKGHARREGKINLYAEK